jgi:hypothetical protein
MAVKGFLKIVKRRRHVNFIPGNLPDRLKFKEGKHSGLDLEE